MKPNKYEPPVVLEINPPYNPPLSDIVLRAIKEFFEIAGSLDLVSGEILRGVEVKELSKIFTDMADGLVASASELRTMAQMVELAIDENSETNGADPDGWNVYRLTGDDSITAFLGSAPTEGEAYALARRLCGIKQIQRGLDGAVVPV